jgi:hypothetical protein
MKWSYKTVHFELKKEGLLGGAFLDEAEIEEQLNDYGRSGWELISVIEVQDGIIAFFKQTISFGLPAHSSVRDDPEPSDIPDYGRDEREPVDWDERLYRDTKTDRYEALQHEDALPEAGMLEDDGESAEASDTVDDEPELENYEDPPPDYQGLEEFEEAADDDPVEKSIGAIRIE